MDRYKMGENTILSTTRHNTTKASQGWQRLPLAYRVAIGYTNCRKSKESQRWSMRVSPSHIEEAAHLIDPVFTHSPQFLAETLSERLGCRLLCKVETVNPIQSFKGRGADYYLARLASAPNRLVCASAGNFGLGLAFAARKRGWPSLSLPRRQPTRAKSRRWSDFARRCDW